jgi:N-acetylglutamate synthase-like GNAT family acetyltransferase
MIRKCDEKDFDTIYKIINDASLAYKGVIPKDRWKEPYMSQEELKHEIKEGVLFFGFEENNKLIGIMGIQDVKDVGLIRHAYVLTNMQNKGVGSSLIKEIQNKSKRPLLIGTWKDAVWAIKFYEKHGFKLATDEEKDRLLKKYWSIPARQVETSVVLADKTWFDKK